MPRSPSRASLSDFFLEHLAGVLDAFLLIRIGLTEGSDISRNLTDQLPVNTLHGNVSLTLNLHVDSIGQIEQDKMKFRSSIYSEGRVVTTCIDGYKFVIVRATKSVAITQSFEEKDGISVPSKC